MNHLYSIISFSQDAECIANSQSRYTGENCSRIALSTNHSLFWFLILSRSFVLSLSLSLSHSLSVSLRLSLAPFLFVPLSFSLSLSHTHIHASLSAEHMDGILTICLVSFKPTRKRDGQGSDCYGRQWQPRVPKVTRHPTQARALRWAD